MTSYACFFLYAHREATALTNEVPEESDQFRCLRGDCLGNVKRSVGLILEEASTMRISIPLDLSSRPFIPLSRFVSFVLDTPHRS